MSQQYFGQISHPSQLNVSKYALNQFLSLFQRKKLQSQMC